MLQLYLLESHHFFSNKVVKLIFHYTSNDNLLPEEVDAVSGYGVLYTYFLNKSEKLASTMDKSFRKE